MRKIPRAIWTMTIMAVLISGCASRPTNSQPVVSESASHEEASVDKPAKIDPNVPAFSVASGFYENGFEVKILSADKGAQIYYTLDGSEPTTASTLYSEPIRVKNRTNEPNVLAAQKDINPDGDYIVRGKVDKATVIRAMAVLSDGTTTKGVQATYFVGINASKYQNAPIISLTTEFGNLFDYNSGIYVLGKAYDDWIKEDRNNANEDGWKKVGNYSQRGREWEREGMMEYITSDGSSGFSQAIGMRIMGAASRSGSQKSFRIIAREDYGKKSVKFPLIPGNMRSDGAGAVTKYKSFVLRNGGNDRDFARVRDPFLQYLAEDYSFDTYASTPVVVFLNGEFWGMYTLTEDYSDNYVENNYGIKDDNVTVIKRGEVADGEESDIEHYKEMMDFIINHDMSVDSNYSKACDYLDIQNFVEYLAFNMYIYNQDSFFEGNNWQMWRAKVNDPDNPYTDGRYRMMAYDTDYSSGIYDNGETYKVNNIANVLKQKKSSNQWYYAPRDLLLSLIENRDFKKRLVLALCDMRNITFEKEHAWSVLEDFGKQYKILTSMTWERFGPEWITYDAASHFEDANRSLRIYLNGRYSNGINLIRNAFGLERDVTVTVECSDATKGTVIFNSSKLDLSNKFVGQYFKEFSVKLKAVPNEGARFAGWEYSGCSVSNPNSDEITVAFKDVAKIKAIFE